MVKTLCSICAKSIVSEDVASNGYDKFQADFVEVTIRYSLKKPMVGLVFCPTCSRKSYTINELKTLIPVGVSNYVHNL